MASITELLRYKAPVKLLDPKTEKTLMTVWVRVLGDEAIKEAYRQARIASAAKRAALRDKESDDYRDAIKSMEEQDDVDLRDVILASNESDYRSLAMAVVQREDLPTIEEVAVEPDAPTLEEQEVLDKRETQINEAYEKEVKDYVDARVTELKARLDASTHDEVVELSQEAMINLAPMQTFLDALKEQKVFRGTFTDKECKTRAFPTLDEYRQTHAAILDQLAKAYDEIEMGPDDIKN